MLRTDLESALGTDFAELFRSIRIEAERRTRTASHSEEVTLEEIWSQLQLMLPGINAAKGMNAELEEERRLLRPNLHVLAGIRMLRKSGVKIAFTSDTYLPRTFIEGLLVQFDFAKQGDSFFVSSELRLTKHSGKLFTRLLEVEAFRPADIIHTGDSERSDVAVPRSMGIQAVHYADSGLHRAELALIGQSDRDPSALTALAGSMRIFRTNHGGAKHDVAASFTSAFLGPFLLTFASWLLARAQGDGIQRLYFLSRDCHLLCRVAEQLSSRFDGIECRYLQTSRQSLFLPTATGLSPSGMPWMRRAFERPVLRRLLAKLELDLSSTGTDMARLAGTTGANRTLESDQDWADFWHALDKEPVASQLKNLIDARRDAANAYFDAQGLNDGVRWALVDLGGQLTCQAAIQTIVRTASPNG
ncbi:MAG TPA: hypothetical protein VK968_02560, partial [Roseimicrobium sp.]|nr:hypothetical protein [Roseimicrobium sp.]